MQVYYFLNLFSHDVMTENAKSLCKSREIGQSIIA